MQVAEAHATDEWPIGNDYNPSIPTRPQTLSVGPRAEAAFQLATAYRLFNANWTVAVDQPLEGSTDGLGPFEQVFAPWPTSWYVLGDERKNASKMGEQRKRWGEHNGSGEGTRDIKKRRRQTGAITTTATTTTTTTTTTTATTTNSFAKVHCSLR
eukprot:gb/GEZN01017036.1/.p1 GENE.gb/GEZN01017036.1/~~gb/GEZN01017036.1/.p1  ORF type:complete len:155 (+),score=50.00 gb/GEZN01017036.1/:199-663(+)